MFKLSREVRFTLAEATRSGVVNGHAGSPLGSGLEPFLTFTVTLGGALDSTSQYLLNIKNIDTAVRQTIVPYLSELRARDSFTQASIRDCFDRLREKVAGKQLLETKLALSPFASIDVRGSEIPMIRLNRRFEFSAAHRLFNPSVTDLQNQSIFGKCSNPHGHGHNYELQVTLRGQPDASGLLIPIPEFESIVMRHAIDVLDHKNLNVEVQEFKNTIPTVENIAKAIFGMLKPHFAAARCALASVTVWETPKTWCEFSED